MLPDLRGTVQLAGALAQAGVAKALEVVGAVGAMNDKDAVVSLVRSEIDQVVGRMGFVREDELAALRRHVERLEHELHEARATEQLAPSRKAAAAAAPESPKPVVKRRKRPAAEAGQ